MNVFGHRSVLKFVVALSFTLSVGHSLAVEAASTAEPSKSDSLAYIGRAGPSSQTVTVMLVPQGDKVAFYAKGIGDVPFPEVTKKMLDYKGTYPLKKPLTEGIYFTAPELSITYSLKREVGPIAPGWVMDSVVEKSGFAGWTNRMWFFKYKGPSGRKQ